jgi:hypothetical protein
MNSRTFVGRWLQPGYATFAANSPHSELGHETNKPSFGKVFQARLVIIRPEFMILTEIRGLSNRL